MLSHALNLSWATLTRRLKMNSEKHESAEVTTNLRIYSIESLDTNIVYAQNVSSSQKREVFQF